MTTRRRRARRGLADKRLRAWYARQPVAWKPCADTWMHIWVTYGKSERNPTVWVVELEREV